MRMGNVLVATAFSFGWTSLFAESNAGQQILISGEFSEICGISIKLPSELTSAGTAKLLDCLGSYKADGGTLLSLAPQGFGSHDSSWTDRFPLLHIQHVGIDRVVKEKNSFISVSKSGSVSAREIVPGQCNVKAAEMISKIYGENWRGWLIEDSYKTKDKNASVPDYCVRYSPVNRCVRVVIGNSKSSATMQQYCVTRNSQDFDLDSGLSYNILLKIFRSIKFNES